MLGCISRRKGNCMPYYKVTTALNESAAVAQYHADSPFCVHYKEGEWVRATVKGTKLFCFDSECAAKEWARNQFLYWRVWECEVENPTQVYTKFWHTVYSKNWEDELKKVLYATALGGRYPFDGPDNTVFADAVKLTKLVEEVA